MPFMDRGFENLECWRHAREFRRAIYEASRKFPGEETFGLTAQVRRAACSVTANIAEGYGRYSFPERIQFCIMARGSLNEVLDHLYVALDEGYIAPERFNLLYSQGRRAEKILNGYITHLRSKVST